MSAHPYLDRSFNIRWSRLTPAHAVPDIRKAIKAAQHTIDTIASHELSGLTFENTFWALEHSTEELSSAWGKLSHLQSVADTKELREAYNTVLPEVTAFYSKIPLNGALWLRLKAFSETPEAAQLSGIRRRFMEETLADFRQSGADLPPDKKLRLEAIQSELAQVTQKYSENVLDSTNAWQLIVDDVAMLDGIPERARNLARQNALKKGYGTEEKPMWRFTLQGPSIEPPMNYGKCEELRRMIWSASVNIGGLEPYDNAALVKRILALRREKAELLGFAHFADFTTARRMAKTGAHALSFIEEIESHAREAFQRECHELEHFKARHTGGEAGPLKAWELSFWAEHLRKEEHDFDEELLRPYFPMNKVIEGLFELCRRVFGIRVRELPAGTAEVWHPEVQVYEMHDEANRHLGSFYADWYPRESKRGGAWMNYLITGGPRADGGRDPHLGLICGNMTHPADGKPALLTHREVETVFHEFGHLLHHLLGEVEIKSMNGVNVAWDFVELPSQIMENWCWERESLDLFARHFETGERLPDALFERLKDAKNFREGCATMRQVQFAKMDLLMHLRTQELIAAPSLEEAVRAQVADTMVPTVPPARPIIKRFNHIFGDPTGYAAGYYSYKWAEVLDADAFTRFHKEGIFSRKVGAEFVEHILSKGNSDDPVELFRRFMGRDPDVNALLERAGLAPTKR